MVNWFLTSVKRELKWIRGKSFKQVILEQWEIISKKETSTSTSHFIQKLIPNGS